MSLSHSLSVTAHPVIGHTRPDLIVALYDAIHLAIANGWGLTVEYATGGESVKLRTLWPIELVTSAAGADCLHAADSLREGFPTFRVDRVRSLIAIVRFRFPAVV